MSSATPSHPALPSTDSESIVAAFAGRLVYGVRATAFWTAAVLPLFVLGAVAVGSAGRYPEALVGALMINALCAVIGHKHTPNR